MIHWPLRKYETDEDKREETETQKWRAVDVEKHNMKWKTPCRDEQMFLSLNPSLYPPLRHEISEGGINTHIHTSHFPVGRFSHIDRRCCDEGFSSSMLAHQWFRLSRNLTCLLREEEEEVGETNNFFLNIYLFFKIFIFLFIFLSFPCYLVFIWTMPETWCYEHFLCLFASSRWMALCIPQL